MVDSFCCCALKSFGDDSGVDALCQEQFSGVKYPFRGDALLRREGIQRWRRQSWFRLLLLHPARQKDRPTNEIKEVKKKERFTMRAAGCNTAICFNIVAPSLVIIVVLSVWIILSIPFGPRLDRIASATPTLEKVNTSDGSTFCGCYIWPSYFHWFFFVLEVTPISTWCCLSHCGRDEEERRKTKRTKGEVNWWW